MNCSDFKLILVEHLDGRLAPDRAAAARSHLESCPACAREVDLHRRTWELAGRIGAIEPDSSFAANVRRRVHRSRVSRIVGSCAAAAAFIVALFFAFGRGPAAVPETEAALRKLDAEDRRLLEELAHDRTWELADNIDVIRAYELLDGNGGAPAPEEDH